MSEQPVGKGGTEHPSRHQLMPDYGCGAEAFRQVLGEIRKNTGKVEWLLFLAALATLLTALLCVWLAKGSVPELSASDRQGLHYFLLFLTSAALLLAIGAIYIKWRICRMDFSSGGVKVQPAELVARMFRFQCMLIGGIFWGLLFGSFPFIFDIYREPVDLLQLRIGVSAFLFSLNMITGAALAAIIVFLRQSWMLAQQDKKVTLYSRSTMLSADYTALLRTLTLIAAAHILLVLISIAFSPFPTPWLLSFTVFSITVLLTIYFVPQLPVKRRLQAEKRELLARIGSAKKRILYSELTPQALEHLAKLSALEEKVSKVSTSLSQRDDAWVKWSALAIGLLPYVGTLLAALGASSESNPFVKTLSEFLPVLKLVFGFPG